MTTEATSDPEVPADTNRKQATIVEPVRQYLRDRCDEEDRTYSQQIEAMLPDDAEEIHHAYPDDEVARLKLTPECYAVIDGMAGQRVQPGEVASFYALVDALERGDLEAAAAIADYIPAVLWDALEPKGVAE